MQYGMPHLRGKLRCRQKLLNEACDIIVKVSIMYGLARRSSPAKSCPSTGRAAAKQLFLPARARRAQALQRAAGAESPPGAAATSAGAPRAKGSELNHNPVAPPAG